MSLIDSPSLRAMSAMERKMMPVVTGTSTSIASGPKKPPTPPETAAPRVCRRFAG